MAKMVNICDVCFEIFAGGDAPKKNMSIVQTDEYNVPIYSNGEANDGLYGFTNFARVSEPSITISARGTIGYTSIRNTPFVPIVRLITLVPKKDVIDIRYLFYAAQNYHFDGSGTSIPQLTVPALKKYNFPLPTIAEQKQIVIVLDKICHLITLRKKQLSKLDELVKSRFIELFGDPVDNPMGWSTKQLQELVTDDCTISYGIVQTGDDQEDGVPVFRPVDIVNRIPVRSELKKTTEEISNKYKRTILKGREMLITVRANIADTCIVGEEFAGCNVGRGIVPIRTKETEMILEFLKYQIDSKHLNDSIKALAKGITLIQLNMEDLREVTLIVPPIEKQKSFVEFAKQTDKSKLAVQQSLEKLEILKKSLMQQYFG